MTSHNEQDGSNSLWRVRDSERAKKTCATGTPVKCGDTIRLEHNPTSKNMHSHSGVKAPLSSRQEVSGYGEDGSGDVGDDWKLVCNERADYGPVKKEGQVITGKDLFKL